jgi:hypothetical protein
LLITAIGFIPIKKRARAKPCSKPKRLRSFTIVPAFTHTRSTRTHEISA